MPIFFGALGDQREIERKRKAADRLIRLYSPRWMSIKGVVACGIGLSNDKDPGSIAIKIYAQDPRSSNLRKIPRKIEGIPILIKQSDEVRALPK